LGPVLLLVKDRSHPQIMFYRAEGVFHFGKLDIGLPQGLGIGFAPVGTQDIAASCLDCPAIALFVLLDLDGESVVSLRHGNRCDYKFFFSKNLKVILPRQEPGTSFGYKRKPA
jgi:hypothetical protein